MAFPDARHARRGRNRPTGLSDFAKRTRLSGRVQCHSWVKVGMTDAHAKGMIGTGSAVRFKDLCTRHRDVAWPSTRPRVLSRNRIPAFRSPFTPEAFRPEVFTVAPCLFHTQLPRSLYSWSISDLRGSVRPRSSPPPDHGPRPEAHSLTNFS